MDNENAEKERVTAENAAGAEKENGAAAELGKFKSVDALLKAYQALESEFTRRNQRLKELEQGNKAGESMQSPLSRGSAGAEEIKTAPECESVRREIIEDYLKSVTERAVPLLKSGVTAASPRVTPKTVKDAGALAQRFLNKD